MKIHWMKGGPFILKGGPRLAKWFIVRAHHSLAKHWGKGVFCLKKGPIQHKRPSLDEKRPD